MPILVEWKWIEKTETYLVVFHFWDDREEENLRMRVLEEGFETLAYVLSKYNIEDKAEILEENFVAVMTAPYYNLSYPRTKAYLSWAPSHAQFCLLTEVLTYANLINGLKPHIRKKLKFKLQGMLNEKMCTERNRDHFLIDYDMLSKMGDKAIVSFSGQDYLSFEVCQEYIEYLRKLIKPYI